MGDSFEVASGPIDELTAEIIGIAGETGSGKTVSAIRLALGMCRIVGGKPCLIDTNSRRGLHYRKPRGPFDYDYIDFAPPFSPARYKGALAAAVKTGSKAIIVDSMSDEHNGEGGIMDQVDRFLDDKCGDDFQKRDKMNMVAHARIKPQRHDLNRYILQLARQGVILILCYRAHDKVKPETGKGIRRVGFEPETTSTLRFEMTQAFLLMPGAQGSPTIAPETNEEKIWSKTPMQFKGWMKGVQLDEEMGQRLAEWAAGKAPASQPRSEPEKGAGLPSSSDFPAPAKKTKKTSTFAETMAALKTQDGKTFIEALGRAGYENIEDIPQNQQAHVYRLVLAEITERKAMQSA